uniref:Uncharacterized protein LOC105068578 isoform X6 n=1 Tax=Camelus bactrianus TaxID=9837 RepID=A0A9W3HGJ3_CAMBA|nr:uncharacterized protein LOC105068578 isoform X6 [Camelus bactrianus]
MSGGGAWWGQGPAALSQHSSRRRGILRGRPVPLCLTPIPALVWLLNAFRTWKPHQHADSRSSEPRLTLFKSVSSHISSTPGAARAESGLCPPGSPSRGGANTVGCLDAVRSTTRSVHLHPLRRWTVREVVGAEPCRLSRGALKTCLLRHLCRRSVRSHPFTLSGAESPAPAAGGARQAQVSSLQEEAPSAQKTPRLAIFQALTCCQGHRSNAGSTWHQQASGPLDEGQGRPACHDLCYQLLAYI